MLRLHLALAQLVGAQLARELDLILNGSVLAEVPVEQIFVVDDLENGNDDISHQLQSEVNILVRAKISAMQESPKGKCGTDAVAADGDCHSMLRMLQDQE